VTLVDLDELINMLTGIYLGCPVIGLLITIILLKPIKSSMSDTGVTLKTRLLSTVRLLCTNLNMLMLVPFSLYTGMEQVVIYAEFTNVSIRMPTSMIDPQDLFSHLHSELKTNLLHSCH
jgi:hypothetical protein